jgi:DNA-binding beta-propeller fold protein YncE
MGLTNIGTVMLPPHRAAGGFDHASVDVSSDRMYVAHTCNNSLEVIDLRTSTHLATLDGFPGVSGAAVDAGRGCIVATNLREGTVGIAPLSDPTAIVRVPVGIRPNGLAIAPDRGLALAALVGDWAVPNSSGAAFVDLDTRRVQAVVPLFGRTRWTIYDERRGLFFVNTADPAIVAISPDGFGVVRTIPVPVAGPHGLELDSERGLLLCAADGGAVVALEADTGRVVAQVPICGSPDVVFFNPRRQRLYVAIANPGVIQVVDTARWTIAETVRTGLGAKTFGFDAIRERLYAFTPESHSAIIFAEG